MDINLLADKISDINRKYSYINYGGCGTFSYYLHKALKENHGVDTDIVYITTDHAPGGKPDYDVKFTHILVRLDIGPHYVYIDNNGLHDWTSGLPFSKLDNLPIEKLEEMINIPELWNNKFDHSQKEELKKDLLVI